MNFKIEWFELIDSTNTYALNNASVHHDLSVFAAEFQTAGRGQRGNQWESRRGENLTFSILLKPDNLKAKNQFAITQAVTLALTDYLRGLGIAAKIKWPNDIYIGVNKTSGILIENILGGDKLTASVIGIGLNFNQMEFDPTIPNPTSIRKELLKAGVDNYFDVKKELPVVLECFSKYIPYISDEARHNMDEVYLERLYKIGVESGFKDNLTGEELHATITGVEDDGKLILKTQQGEIKRFYFKEVSYL